MNRLLRLLVLVGCSASAQVSEKVDSISPGILHYQIQTVEPNSIHLLELNLRDRHNVVLSFRPRGLERLSDQFQKVAHSNPGTIAGINADFFSYATGQPLGNQIVDGGIVSAAASSRAHFIMDTEGRPRIEFLSFAGVFWSATGFRDSIHVVNQRYDGPGLALYSSSWLDTVSEGVARTRILLRLCSPKLVPSDTLVFIKSDNALRTYSQFGDSLVILSIAENVRTKRFQQGDTLFSILSVGSSSKILQAVGGGGRMLHFGRPIDSASSAAEGLKFDFVTARHPRTFVAFNDDTSKLVFGTVDGRQSGSRGMNLLELAQLLLQRGYSEAINLDGGGSTTLIIQSKVVNLPSDKAGERKVANGLFISRR